jgi:type II secretory pathway pseudopilin PulG
MRTPLRRRLRIPKPPLGRPAGFTFIEALLSIALLGIAVLGLAQMFILSVRNNLKSGEISQSMFIAQQQVDYLRTLTAAELGTFPSTARGESNDEILDVNRDGITEYRRLTQVTISGSFYSVKVLVFPTREIATAAADLYADPAGHSVRANMNTVIGR